MDCPKCGDGMTAGVLMGGRGDGVYWLSKEYRKKHAFAPVTKKAKEEAGMFAISSGGGVFTQNEDFYVCKKCGLLMAELPNIKEAADSE
ncbi:PF20097 family protein [uncultured Ruminococcus sp.]|uniref:PF20097 family protein n=1 Tax=uncultured Ruminococcus sp. TaxID=165186 RepID=UPI000EDDEA2B|nr:PF20097 family protein [uncultured Ruminococcus sp.]HCJ41151.1 hypothetical protein [Ruminococcus sp.]